VNSFIYKIECMNNKKVYIGKTIYPHGRWKNHLNQLRAGIHPVKLLQEDYRNYGEAAFDFSVICTVEQTLNQSTGNNKDSEEEKRQMAIRKSYLPEYGYNYRDKYFYPLKDRRLHTLEELQDKYRKAIGKEPNDFMEVI